MSHKLAKVTVLAALTVSLSGCAQISQFGDNMWGHTKNAWGYSKTAANFVVSPVTKLLRSAPSQNYVFESAAVSQQRVKTAFLNDGKLLASQVQAQGLVTPQLAQLPTPQTPHDQQPVYASQSYQSAYANPSLTPQLVIEAAPIAALSAPRTTDNISFVKMGGGSNMQDWVMCEAEAGGFIRIVQSGYLIEPRFESCMRAKGYKPESEVAEALSL